MLLRSQKAHIVLYSRHNCPWGDRIRILLEEKEAAYTTVGFQADNPPDELRVLAPDGDHPVLADRELALYDLLLISEYLDERFPHPPLIPGEPLVRARLRLFLLRLDRDWKAPWDARKPEPELLARIATDLAALNGLLAQQDYLLGSAYSMGDCALAPWILRIAGTHLTLPPAIKAYADRLRERPAIQRALFPKRAVAA